MVDMQGFNPTYPKYLFSQTDTTLIINLNLKLHSEYIDYHIYIPIHLLSQANVTNFFTNSKSIYLRTGECERFHSYTP